MSSAKYKNFLINKEKLNFHSNLTMTSSIHPEDIKFAFNTCKLLATRSRAERARVGCVIWDIKKRTIISVGYNGTPTNSDNTMELGGKTLPHVIHAEENAISKLSTIRKYVGNHIIFVTHSPCLGCAKQIVSHGNIKQVFYLENYGDYSGLKCLRDAGLEVKRFIL